MKKMPDLFGKETPVNLFDYDHALTLAKAIQKKHLTRRKIVLKSWMPHFRLLRVSDGIEEDRIKKVLEWFLEHIRDKYTPKVYSAQGFREKFFQIEAAMEREEEDEEEEKIDDFDVKEYKNGDDIIIEIDYGDSEREN